MRLVASKWPYILNGINPLGLLKSVNPVNHYIPARRVGPKPVEGNGQVLAEARLRAKRKANKAIPSGYRMTRQQRRAAERADAKRERLSPAEFGRRKMGVINRGAAA